MLFSISTLLLLWVYPVVSQEKYVTKSGEIKFEASGTSIEPVKAKNEGVSAILNTENGTLAVLALVKGFRFRVALMEEHFNENYLESQQYPKATFKGKMLGFSKDALGDGKVLETMLKGQLTIKGKTKEVISEALVKYGNGKLFLQTEFAVNPEDFDIKIPKIVQNKISNRINISVDLELTKRK